VLKAHFEEEYLMEKELDSKTESNTLKVLPVLPLRDVVVYPYMVIPLFVGRDKSIKALEEATEQNKQIVLVAQKDSSEDEPDTKDLYKTGTLANILQLLKLPDGTVKVLVEGTQRAKVIMFDTRNEFIEAEVTPFIDAIADER
jgi:ATP-dependent Lon protease